MSIYISSIRHHIILTYWCSSNRQIELDCEFLEAERIMDYSLLVGIHFRDENTSNKIGLSPFVLRSGNIYFPLFILILMQLKEKNCHQLLSMFLQGNLIHFKTKNSCVIAGSLKQNFKTWIELCLAGNIRCLLYIFILCIQFA